jgi:hypothetical protein
LRKSIGLQTLYKKKNSFLHEAKSFFKGVKNSLEEVKSLFEQANNLKLRVKLKLRKESLN